MTSGCPRSPPEVTAVALRVLSEALTNVEQHAPGAAVSVEARVADDRLSLVIADDGPGFVAAPPAAGHFGLLLMRERARTVGGVAGRRQRARPRQPRSCWTFRSDRPRVSIIPSLAEHLEAEACPHLAVFLRAPEELPELLVSFYALGVRRGGWLAHRALPDDAEHERRVLTDAGLDVATLEASDRMVIVELDFDAPAEGSTDRWAEALDAALARGCTGLWYARFPVDPGDAGYEAVLGYEREWHRAFRGRPVVTICPFITRGLDEDETAAAVADVSESHTGVVVSEPSGGFRSLAG